MFRIVCGFLYTLISFNVIASDGVDFFYGSLDEALEKASSEEKLVFVDISTDWCVPCKSMNKNVFTDKKVSEFFNAHFVSMKLNAEDEETDGPFVAKKYRMMSLPFYLFLKPDGTLVIPNFGFLYPDEFIFLGELALKGGDLSEFDAMEHQYDEGGRAKALLFDFVRKYKVASNVRILDGYLNEMPSEPEALSEYAKPRVKASEILEAKALEAADLYFSSLSDEEFDQRSNYQLILRFKKLFSPDHRVVKLLTENQQHYQEMGLTGLLNEFLTSMKVAK